MLQPHTYFSISHIYTFFRTHITLGWPVLCDHFRVSARYDVWGACILWGWKEWRLYLLLGHWRWLIYFLTVRWYLQSTLTRELKWVSSLSPGFSRFQDPLLRDLIDFPKIISLTMCNDLYFVDFCVHASFQILSILWLWRWCCVVNVLAAQIILSEIQHLSFDLDEWKTNWV